PTCELGGARRWRFAPLPRATTRGGHAQRSPAVANEKTNSDAAQQGDGPNTTATAPDSQELEALRKRAAERDQFLDLLQRTKADFDNYQKRNQREREQERRYQYGPFVRDLLPVFDNLQRATAAAKQAGEQGPLVQGVAMVQN